MEKKSYFICVMLAAGLLVFLSDCSLNVTDPNAATDNQVLTSPSGIMALAVGLQQAYATSALSGVILYTGITTRELACNYTQEQLIELEAGGSQLLNTNTALLPMWSNLFQVIGMSDQLIANAPKVTLDPGTLSGILAEAYLFKAMALGNLAQDWQEAPIDVDPSGHAKFVSGSDLFAEAIALLDSASQVITTTPPSSQFNSKVIGGGFNLANTIQAYLARYDLFAGRYQDAIDAANKVSLTVTSVFSFSTLSQNLIYYNVTTIRWYAARDSFGTPLYEAGDQRVNFYLKPDSGALSSPNHYPISFLVGFFGSATQSIPAYLPGEMHLIKAEANVMLGNLTSAVSEINAVRTKTPSQDPYSVGASLPAYSGSVTSSSLLDEIYYQRCAELYLEGMRLEDSRRLGRPGPPVSSLERNRNYYPYPLQERVSNPNTPPDPAN